MERAGELPLGREDGARRDQVAVDELPDSAAERTGQSLAAMGPGPEKPGESGSIQLRFT
ncbi:MAG: hypothetical protein ACTMH8_11490 [Brevibacterium aurantiacum]